MWVFDQNHWVGCKYWSFYIKIYIATLKDAFINCDCWVASLKAATIWVKLLFLIVALITLDICNAAPFLHAQNVIPLIWTFSTLLTSNLAVADVHVTITSVDDIVKLLQSDTISTVESLYVPGLIRNVTLSLQPGLAVYCCRVRHGTDSNVFERTGAAWWCHYNVVGVTLAWHNGKLRSKKDHKLTKATPCQWCHSVCPLGKAQMGKSEFDQTPHKCTLVISLCNFSTHNDLFYMGYL